MTLPEHPQTDGAEVPVQQRRMLPPRLRGGDGEQQSGNNDSHG